MVGYTVGIAINVKAFDGLPLPDSYHARYLLDYHFLHTLKGN